MNIKKPTKPASRHGKKMINCKRKSSEDVGKLNEKKIFVFCCFRITKTNIWVWLRLTWTDISSDR